MAITLVLADAHPLLLDGLQTLLDGEGDMQVLARCADGEAALAAVCEHGPDMLVLDLRMPRMNGLAVLRQLKARGDRPRVVLLTAAVSSEELMAAMRLGVRGVVLKDMAPALLVQCIRKVHGGGTWLERGATAHAMDALLRREIGQRELADMLTQRELAVVRAVAQGLRNKEIARSLDIQEGTVKTHLHNTYRKLGLTSRLGLSTHLRDCGIVS